MHLKDFRQTEGLIQRLQLQKGDHTNFSNLHFIFEPPISNGQVSGMEGKETERHF